MTACLPQFRLKRIREKKTRLKRTYKKRSCRKRCPWKRNSHAAGLDRRLVRSEYRHCVLRAQSAVWLLGIFFRLNITYSRDRLAALVRGNAAEQKELSFGDSNSEWKEEKTSVH